MSKNTVLAVLAVAAGAVAAGVILSKQEQLSAEEREKIEQSKEYLEEKGYVVVSKKNYAANSLNLFSVASLPTYYKAAKTIAKFVM